MKMLELKVPPPAVALAAALAMWLATSASGALNLTLPNRLAIANTLAVLGIAISMDGFFSFQRAGTTVNPTRPHATSSLVEGGVYRYTRNPMYLGLLLVLAGWAAYLSNAVALAGLVVFVLYINRFQIGPEERVLAAKFGTAFDDYRRRTRRWI